MTYLFMAFTIVWLGLFIYLAILARRQQKLLDEIKMLKESLSREERENSKFEIRNLK